MNEDKHQTLIQFFITLSVLFVSYTQLLIVNIHQFLRPFLFLFQPVYFTLQSLLPFPSQFIFSGPLNFSFRFGDAPSQARDVFQGLIDLALDLRLLLFQILELVSDLRNSILNCAHDFEISPPVIFIRFRYIIETKFIRFILKTLVA